jgi:methylmalonyl-CoA epimerase
LRLLPQGDQVEQAVGAQAGRRAAGRRQHGHFALDGQPLYSAPALTLLGFEVLLARELSGDWVDALLGGGPAVMDCVILQPPGGGARLELLAYRTPAPVELDGLSQPSALGLRHIAFEVEDLDAAVEELKAAGVRMIDEKPREGAHGARIAFIHPKSTHGVLIELCQHAAGH